MRVLWTDHALDELEQTFKYHEHNFSDKEIQRLANKIESTLRLISKNPLLYPPSNSIGHVRRALVTPHNTLYYRLAQNNIEILSFFSNRRDFDELIVD